MTRVDDAIMENGGLEREGEGKETRRRIQGEKGEFKKRTKQAEQGGKWSK
jgi:hypothetical protein